MTKSSHPLTRRTWLLIGSLLLAGIFLLGLTLLHAQSEIRLQQQSFSATGGVTSASLLDWPLWSSPAISWIIWLLLATLVIVTLFCLWRGRLPLIAAGLIGLIALAGVIAQFVLPNMVQAQVAEYKQEVYQAAIESYFHGDYAVAAEQIQKFLRSAQDPYIQMEATGWLSGARYYQHDYAASIAAACDYARQASAEEKNWDANILTLHWAIYQLGQSSANLDEAIQHLDQIAACQGIAEASHHWLAISPRLYIVATDSYAFGTTNPRPETREALRHLLERYPNEDDAAMSLLILGDYDQMIQHFPTSRWLDQAYYGRAVRADDNGDFDEARAAYQAFIDRFPQETRAFIAIRRISDLLVRQGDIPAALTYLLRATYPAGTQAATDWDSETEPFRKEILHLLDVRMKAADIERYIAQHPAAPAQDLLRFSLAANLMAEDRYAEAQPIFQALADAASTDTNLQQFSQDNLHKIAVIQANLQSSNPEARLNLAAYLLQDRPIFYNELWQSRRRSVRYQQDTPWAYYLQRNDHLRAVALLEKYLDQYPDAPRTEEALMALGQAYAALGSSSSLLPFDPPAGYDVKALRHKAVEAFTTLIQKYPESRYFDTALAETGLVYIEDEPLDSESAIQQFRALAQNYPQHHLANNALNWVAYFECHQAYYEKSGSSTWREKYEQALDDYQMILEKYPEGHVGRTAQENIKLIQDTLAHPEHWSTHCVQDVP